MPFTFSHPAIILVLSKVDRTKLSFTGLIVGSIAPDFEYFIFMRMSRTHGHDMSSFLWFNLPICIALALLYHGIIKKPFINSLPHFLYSRLSTYNDIDWFNYLKRYWFVFIYSAAIGVFSHIFWDSFTHDNGLLGKSPQFLLQPIGYREMKLYELLQWLSTFGGLLIILQYLTKLKSHSISAIPIKEKISFWLWVSITMLVIYSIKTPDRLSDLIAVVIGSFLYGIIMSSILHLIMESVQISSKDH